MIRIIRKVKPELPQKYFFWGFLCGVVAAGTIIYTSLYLGPIVDEVQRVLAG